MQGTAEWKTIPFLSVRRSSSMVCSSGWSEWRLPAKTSDMEGCVNLQSSIVVPVAFANSIRATLDTTTLGAFLAVNEAANGIGLLHLEGDEAASTTTKQNGIECVST